MAELDREAIKKLAQLSRIRCTEEESERLLKDLRKIVDYVQMLERLETADTPVCSYVLEEVVNVLREDSCGPTLGRDEFLANSPSHVGGMVRVPPVLKEL
jgi:aspartyl-tRNA(Asn)/glutamyl-tRNA(Gln) amidotransferase subunit C